MTQEEKELVLKDLCARLPYGVHVEISWEYSKTDVYTSLEYYEFPNIDSLLNMFWDEKCISIKPYLRQMSSMTEEENNHCDYLVYHMEDWLSYYDYLNSIYLDHRGLIDKGLALEAPEDMYKIKEMKKAEQEEDTELTDFESALFSAFSDAWQEYLSGKEVNVAKWTKEHSPELLEVAREQKPAWSEEDDKKRKGLIKGLEDRMGFGWACDPFSREEYIDWLKSLKDRVQPQPKQEWSERDENEYNHTLKILKLVALEQETNGYNNLIGSINWLQSLKEKYTWKPSDEQMEALLKLEEMHVLEHEKNQENAHLYMVIKSLREQLLKLKKGE